MIIYIESARSLKNALQSKMNLTISQDTRYIYEIKLKYSSHEYSESEIYKFCFYSYDSQPPRYSPVSPISWYSQPCLVSSHILPVLVHVTYKTWQKQ